MTYDGSAWKNVGDQGFFKVQAKYVGLATADNDIVVDLVNNSKDGEIARRSMGVATYSGGTWTSGESSLLTSGQGVYYTKMGGNGKIATLISINRGAVDGVGALSVVLPVTVVVFTSGVVGVLVEFHALNSHVGGGGTNEEVHQVGEVNAGAFSLFGALEKEDVGATLVSALSVTVTGNVKSGAVESSRVAGHGFGLEGSGVGSVLRHFESVGVVGDGAIPIEEVSVLSRSSGDGYFGAGFIGVLGGADSHGAEGGVIAVHGNGVGGGSVGNDGIGVASGEHHSASGESDAENFENVFHLSC